MMPLIRRGKDPVTIAALQHPLRVGDVVLLAAGADKSLYNYSGMRYDEYTKRTKHSYVDADGSVKSEYLD